MLKRRNLLIVWLVFNFSRQKKDQLFSFLNRSTIFPLSHFYLKFQFYVCDDQCVFSFKRTSKTNYATVLLHSTFIMKFKLRIFRFSLTFFWVTNNLSMRNIINWKSIKKVKVGFFWSFTVVSELLSQ